MAEKRRAAWQNASAFSRLKSKRRIRTAPAHGIEAVERPETPQRAVMKPEEMEEKLRGAEAEREELRKKLEASEKKQALAQKREAETAKKLANARAALKLIQKRLNLLPLVTAGGSPERVRSRGRRKEKAVMSRLRALNGGSCWAWSLLHEYCCARLRS